MSGQNGDTLIEIVLASAILSWVLASGFAVADLAYRTNLSARERTQAIGLLQEQAEALRNTRDSMIWTQTNLAVPQNGGFRDIMATRLSGIQMVAQNNASGGGQKWAINSTPSFTTGIYTLAVKPTLSALDKITFDMTAQWTGIGGQTNTSNLTVFLVNLDDLNPYNCNGTPSGVPC